MTTSKPQLLKLALVTPDPEPILATKVTGFNLGILTKLVSLAAERGGYYFKLEINFAADGSLVSVLVPKSSTTYYGDDRGYPISAGHWAYLHPGEQGIRWGFGHPVRDNGNHYRELV